MIPLVVIIVVILGAAVLAVTRRNLIHAALLLAVNWVGIACFYLWAGAEFVAFAQVLVYVGAVSMIVLFAVLLTRRTRDGEVAVATDSFARVFAGMVTAFGVFGVLAYAVITTNFAGGPLTPPQVTVEDIGRELMGPQLAALLVIGALLTVALIGAVVIAAPERKEGGE